MFGRGDRVRGAARVRGLLPALLCGLAFTAFLSWIGAPLPFLFGPMISGLLMALAGLRPAGPGRLGAAARTIIGVSAGAAITPDVIGRLPDVALSLAFVPVLVIAAGAIAYPYFRWVCGYGHATAYYSAMPGGLQDMLAFGEEAGADLRVLSLIHATRVMLVIAIVPAVIGLAFGADLHGQVGRAARDVSAAQLVLMAATAAFGWWGAVRIGLFGASVVGPMLLAAVLSSFGVLHARPPSEAILAAQFLIGMAVGVHYVGLTLREFARIVLIGGFYVVALIGMTGLLTWILFKWAGFPVLVTFLAFAPGGQAEMAVLALVAGADVGVVVVHHVTRVIVVVVGSPILDAVLRRR